MSRPRPVPAPVVAVAGLAHARIAGGFADVATFTRVLTESPGEALPPGMVEVERARGWPTGWPGALAAPWPCACTPPSACRCCGPGATGARRRRLRRRRVATWRFGASQPNFQGCVTAWPATARATSHPDVSSAM